MGDCPLSEEQAVSPAEIFNEAFPYYLSIGMSYDLYWDGRPELVIPYRKADVLRQKRENNNAWLQGAYFRLAVLSSLDKKAKYPKQPIEIAAQQEVKRNGLTAKQEKAKAAMMAFAERFNQKMHSDAEAKG